MSPVEFFKALADDTRLRLLLLIQREDELCVCELMQALGLSQPKISRHLALLKKAGLLLDRRQGLWVFYRLHPELPAWCRQILSGPEHQSWLAQNLAALEAMGDRPERKQSCC